MVSIGKNLKAHPVPTPLLCAGTPIALIVKTFFIISDLNLLYLSLKPFSLILPLHSLIKRPYYLSCRLL